MVSILRDRALPEIDSYGRSVAISGTDLRGLETLIQNSMSMMQGLQFVSIDCTSTTLAVRVEFQRANTAVVILIIIHCGM